MWRPVTSARGSSPGRAWCQTSLESSWLLRRAQVHRQRRLPSRRLCGSRWTWRRRRHSTTRATPPTTRAADQRSGKPRAATRTAAGIRTSASGDSGRASLRDRGCRGRPHAIPVGLRVARRERRPGDLAVCRRASARQRVSTTADADVRLPGLPDRGERRASECGLPRNGELRHRRGEPEHACRITALEIPARPRRRYVGSWNARIRGRCRDSRGSAPAPPGVSSGRSTPETVARRADCRRTA